MMDEEAYCCTVTLTPWTKYQQVRCGEMTHPPKLFIIKIKPEGNYCPISFLKALC